MTTCDTRPTFLDSRNRVLEAIAVVRCPVQGVTTAWVGVRVPSNPEGPHERSHAVPPSPPPVLPQPLADATFVPDAARAERGGVTYAHQCLQCHGAGAVSGGKAPDLRASPVLLDPAAYMDVVLGGGRLMNGMPVFPSLTELEAEDIRHYVRSQAALGLPKE